MRITWSDHPADIAETLEEHHPGEDNINTSFTNLRAMIMNLEDFDDDGESGCNERKLEAIQEAWIKERKERDE